MKIVVISNVYPPYVRGGAELIAQQMAEGFAEHLQHVTVFTARPYNGLGSLAGERVRINGIKAWRFYPLNIYFYLRDSKFPAIVRFVWRIFDTVNIHSAIMLYRQLKKESPDVVITHNLVGFGMLTPLVIRLARLRHVHIIHDVQLYNPSGIILTGHEDSNLQRLSTILGYPRIMRFLFKHVDTLISPSKFLLDFYTGKDFFKKAKKKVLPNPIALFPSELNVTTSSSLRLLYLGSISSAKGVPGLLTAMERVDAPVTLKLVGTGPELRSLIIQTKDDSRITFYGWQQRALLSHFFLDTDVVVVPTQCYDNSPTVVYESLAHGIPVIVSDSGGAKELIENGKNGWVFNSGDWAELADRIASAADNLERTRSMSKYAADSVAAYTRSNYIALLLDTISSEES